MDTLARVPRLHSEEDERALLGAMLEQSEEALAQLSRIRPEHLSLAPYRRILEAIRADGRGDPLGVREQLQKRGELDDATDHTLRDLLGVAPLPANAAEYARRVLEAAERRELWRLGHALRDLAEAGAPLDDMYWEATKALGRSMGATETPWTSWSPVDLSPVLEGDALDEPPSLLARTDGRCLIYPGRIHAFNGAPETGKTWLALAACAERIALGEHVIYADFENNPEAAVGNLRSLGLADEEVKERFHYVRPDGRIDAAARDALDTLLASVAPTLAVIDGVTEAMTLFGLDLLSNADVARFIAAAARPLADHGPAVVLIDHVPKDRDSRGRYALGGQHKLAGIDAAYSFDVVRPLIREGQGEIKITVTKDRPGWVRKHSAGSKHDQVGVFYLTSGEGDRVWALIRPVEGGDRESRPTELMQRLSQALEEAGELPTRGHHVAPRVLRAATLLRANRVK